MAEERKEDASEVYKVDTVPPPPDSDAYSAPTKVGEISQATWSAMLRATTSETKLAAVGDPQSGPPASSSGPPISGSRSSSSSPAPSKPQPVDLPPNSVPQMYADEDGDEENQATLLHPNTKRFSVPQPSLPPLFTSRPPAPTPTPTQPPAVPELSVTATDGASWPFAPALIAPSQPTDMRRAIVLGLVSFVVALIVFASIVWLWL